MIEVDRSNGINKNRSDSKNFFKPKKIFIFGLILSLTGLILEICSSVYVKKNYYEQTTYDSEPIYIKDLDLDSFKNIDINVANSDVEFIDSKNYGISICYYTNSKGYGYNVQSGDNELRIRDDFSKINNNIYMPFYTLKAQYPPTGYIKVYMPIENEYNKININTLGDSDISINATDSKLKCNELNIASDIIEMRSDNVIEIQSGNIKLNNIDAQDTEIVSHDGKSVIRNLASDRFYYSKIDGETIFENINLNYINKSKIELSLSGGKADISNMLSKNIVCNSNSEKINFNNINADSLEMNNYNGKVNISKVESNYLDYYSAGNTEFKDAKIDKFILEEEGGKFKILDSTINKFECLSECVDLDLSNVSIAQNLKVDADIGTIKADGNFLGDTSINLYSGDIDFNTSVDESLCNYNLKTYNHIFVNGKEYDYDTVQYDDDIEYENDKKVVNKHETDLTNTINITSEEGNINLNFK